MPDEYLAWCLSRPTPPEDLAAMERAFDAWPKAKSRPFEIDWSRVNANPNCRVFPDGGPCHGATLSTNVRIGDLHEVALIHDSPTAIYRPNGQYRDGMTVYAFAGCKAEEAGEESWRDRPALL